MSIKQPARLPALRFGALLLGAALLVSCSTPAPVPAPAPVVRPEPLSDGALLEQGLQFAVDDLLAQAANTPAFQPPAKGKLPKPEATSEPIKPLIVINNTLEGSAGQQTVGTRQLDMRLLQLLQLKQQTHEVALLDTENIKKASILVTGTLTPVSAKAGNVDLRINLSLTDLNSGFVIAQAQARVRPTGVDETPTQLFRESPAMSKDRTVDGQIRTAQTAPGGEADGVYLARLPVSALIGEGEKRYEAGQCNEALKYYESAAARPEGKQLRVLNAIYLCQMQLGQTSAAEQAFGRIVSLGLATNNLSVKFYFKPGSTDFIADAKITAAYGMWLRQIARETSNAKLCLRIIGHTSKTGSEQVNDRLSMQRAVSIQRRLEGYNADINGKLQSVGMGFRENIVGSGTDDLRDAPDRRVEFKVNPC